MPTYTVHAPPPPDGTAPADPERFVFVRDGFHFWAFVLAPLWLLAHRLWLAFVIYVIGYGVIEAALAYGRIAPAVQTIVGLLVALLIGFEAPSIRRWTLSRRGWRNVGFVVGEDREIAERRFFGEWAKRAADNPPPPVPPGPPAAPVRRGPPSGNDVIGLFPEPGVTR